MRLARRGCERRVILDAITRRHPKHGYNSLVYGETVKERGFAAAGRYAERTVDKAIRIVEQGWVLDPTEARARIAELWVIADAEPWPLELAGARKALEAALEIGDERGRISLGLDLRTHAMRAGQSRTAIGRHRRTLHDLGWMRRNPHDRVGLTARFRLAAPAGPLNDLVEGQLDGPARRSFVAHDAWRPAALGDAGWYVQHAIAAHAPLPAGADLVVERLHGHGLGRELHAAELARRLDIAAHRLGTAGDGDRQRAQFEQERAEHAQSLNGPRSRGMQTAASIDEGGA
jgi:hypothetical protein